MFDFRDTRPELGAREEWETARDAELEEYYLEYKNDALGGQVPVECEICQKQISEDKLIPITLEDEPLVVCTECESKLHVGHWRSR